MILNKMLSEFQALCTFFEFLSYAKRKYPQSVTYRTKYLTSLINDEKQQEQEVKLFQNFLIQNQKISEKILDVLEFKTGKSDIILMMKNFLVNDKEDIFWNELQKLEKILFPNGKPLEISKTDLTGVSGVLEKFKNNPLMSDVLNHAVTSLDLNGIQDVNDLLGRQEFKDIVEKVKTNLSKGNYSLKDITQTVTDVIDSVKDNVDEKTRETLKTVGSAMTSVEKNEPIDMNQLLNLVTSINLN
jgi:hypothetical protein